MRAGAAVVAEVADLDSAVGDRGYREPAIETSPKHNGLRRHNRACES